MVSSKKIEKFGLTWSTEGKRFIELLHPELDSGEALELFVLGLAGRMGPLSGVYNDRTKLWERARECLKGQPTGVFVSLNPIKSGHRKSRKRANGGDVLRRTNFLIDIDPPTPIGRNATADESQVAFDMQETVVEFLQGIGINSFIRTCSGRGFGIIVRIDLRNDEDSKRLLDKCLKAIKKECNDTPVERIGEEEPKELIDTQVTDAARVTRFCGTINRKGKEEPGRSQQRSGFIDPGSPLVTVSREQLEELAALAPVDKPTSKVSRQGPARTDTREVKEIKQALECIEPDEYDTWIKMGMALHSESDSWFPIWDEWSQGSDKYTPGLTKKKWKSFGTDRDGGITIRTLFYLAEKNGYKRDNVTERAPFGRKRVIEQALPACQQMERSEDDTDYVRDLCRCCVEYGANVEQTIYLIEKCGVEAAQEVIEEQYKQSLDGAEWEIKLEKYDAAEKVLTSKNQPIPWKEYEIAPVLQNEHFDHTSGFSSLRYHNGEIIRWEDGKYSSVGERMWQRYLLNRAGETFNKITHRQVIFAAKHLEARNLVELNIEAPCWLGNAEFPADECLETTDKIVHLPSFVDGKRDYAIDATPKFLSFTNTGYAWPENDPGCPQFLEFLDQVFDGDKDQIRALQLWFGYCLLPDVSQHKALMLLGKPRTGKSIIGDVLATLIGKDNRASPRLESLGREFGLQPLLNKRLAILPDVKGKTADEQIQTILNVSAGDSVSVSRKHVDDVETVLPVKLVWIGNHLPVMSDESKAATGRFIVLQTQKSFVGKEDFGLKSKVLAELPGILHWAINGFSILEIVGRLHQPDSTRHIIDRIEDCSAGVSRFIELYLVPDENYREARADVVEALNAFLRDEGETEFKSSVRVAHALTDAGLDFRQGRGLKTTGEKHRRNAWGGFRINREQLEADGINVFSAPTDYAF